MSVFGSVILGGVGFAIAYTALVAPWLSAYRQRTRAFERLGVVLAEHLGRWNRRA